MGSRGRGHLIDELTSAIETRVIDSRTANSTSLERFFRTSWYENLALRWLNGFDSAADIRLISACKTERDMLPITIGANGGQDV